jgi:ribose transport system substrate-binding protein
MTKLRAFVIASVAISSIAMAGTAFAQTRQSVALVVGQSGDPFFTSMQCGAEEAAGKLGLDLFTTGPTSYDPSMQVSVLDATLARNPVGLALVPTSRKALIPSVERANSMNIKIVQLDTTVDSDIPLSTIGTDNVEGGRRAGERIVDLLGQAGGEVLVVGNIPGISALDERHQGFNEVIRKHPNIQVVGVEYSGADPSKTVSILNATLTAHPDLKGIFVDSTLSAEAMGNAIAQKGLQNALAVVAFDASPREVELVRQGAIDELVVQNPRKMGYDAIAQLSAALRGRPVEKRILTPIAIVDRKNVNSDEMKKVVYVKSCK